MFVFKKIIMGLLISMSLMLSAPSVMAAEGGAPEQTLTDVIDFAQQTIAAMENDEDYSVVAALLKETKQASKSVVISGPADLQKQRGSTKIKKSRKAYRAGDKEKAIKLAKEALDHYKKAKAKHFN